MAEEHPFILSVGEHLLGAYCMYVRRHQCPGRGCDDRVTGRDPATRDPTFSGGQTYAEKEKTTKQYEFKCSG